MGEWIEWKGGECPVAKNVMVECRYRGPPNDDQFAIYEMVAGWFNWSHDGENDDIIAYRVVTPEPTEAGR